MNFVQKMINIRKGGLCPPWRNVGSVSRFSTALPYMPQSQYPKNYKPILNRVELQKALFQMKRSFCDDLFEKKLKLFPHVAPVAFVMGSGINDDLDGSEVKSSVKFHVSNLKTQRGVWIDTSKLQETHGFDAEIVQSLAKWKRQLLGDFYKAKPGEGIYVESASIRKGYFGDQTHSNLCEQWDWELLITEQERNLEFLKGIVRKIWSSIKYAENVVLEAYPKLNVGEKLPDEITFVTSQQLHDMFPGAGVHGRENKGVDKYGAMFIIGMGHKMSDGSVPEEIRAPDYDDWSLNGDIMVKHPVTGYRHELSSMGIRVDAKSLRSQLKERNMEDRMTLPFHKAVLEGKLPQTIGGGIGITRLAMLLLRTGHIGECQAAIWHPKHVQESAKAGMHVIPAI